MALGLSADAAGQLQIANGLITDRGRVGGAAHSLVIPVGNVIAIYARENGQGMAFPVPNEASSGSAAADAASPEAPAARATHLSLTEAPRHDADAAGEPSEPPEPPAGGRPSLKRVK